MERLERELVRSWEGRATGDRVGAVARGWGSFGELPDRMGERYPSRAGDSSLPYGEASGDVLLWEGIGGKLK